MSDTKLMFEQRRQIKVLQNYVSQLEHVARELEKASHLLVEEFTSVACGWAFDQGMGNPELTEEQIKKILEERKTK